MRSSPSPARTKRRLFLEPLEGRSLLATLTVNTVADNSSPDDFLTLREALALVNADGDAIVALGSPLSNAEAALVNTSQPFGTNDTIQFQSNLAGQTITLTNGELPVQRSVKINGPSAGLTIDGNLANRIFNIDDGNASVDRIVSIDDLNLQNGRALTLSRSEGAAIFNAENLSLTRCTLTANIAEGDGGAIFNDVGANVFLGDSTISGNQGRFGGGIYSEGQLSIVNSLIANNTAEGNGGGINSGNVLTIVNSTISGNKATRNGGGLLHQAASGTVVNTTITGNVANSDDGSTLASGGGITVAGTDVTTLVLHNTIVAGNFVNSSFTPNDLSSKNVSSASRNNLIGAANSAGGLTNNVNGNKVGFTAQQVLDLNLANNGGPTKTHALVANSPAINAGDNTHATTNGEVGGDALTTDERGATFKRIISSTVDIGAYEAQGARAAINRLNSGVAGEAIRFVVTASYDSPPEAPNKFTFVVNWGDGAAAESFTNRASGSVVSHIFPESGEYNIIVRAIDANGITGAPGTQEQPLLISRASIREGNVLYVGGGRHQDVITLTAANDNGNRVLLRMNNQSIFELKPSKIIVYGNGGNDSIKMLSHTVNGRVVRPIVPIVVFGGDGHDTIDLSANRGHSIAVGGTGSDRILGSLARDLLIGGEGKDTITGGGEQDIVIGATTKHDANLNMLDQLLAAWVGPGTYDARRNALLRGTPTRKRLSAATVLDDAVIDSLNGEAATDWYFARLIIRPVGAKDAVKSAEGETVTEPRPSE